MRHLPRSLLLVLILSSVLSIHLAAAAPTVIEVLISVGTVADTSIDQLDVGEVFGVVIVYDQAMDFSTLPDVAFDPNASSTLPTRVVREIDPHPSPRYVWYEWTIADANVLELGVDIQVSGGKAADGTLQTPHTAADAFDIRTGNPNPPQVTEVQTAFSTGAQNHPIIGQAQVGMAFSVSVFFDQWMDFSTLPTLTFDPDSSGTFPSQRIWDTWAYQNGSWIVYEWTIADSNQRDFDVDISVSGGVSIDGVVQADYTETDKLDIITYDPTIPVVTAFAYAIGNVADTLIDGSDVGKTFEVNIIYDGVWMDFSAPPDVTFDPAIGGTLGVRSIVDSSAGTNGSWISYEWPIIDAELAVSAVDIVVDGGASIDGVQQVAYTEANALDVDIDTRDPTITGFVATPDDFLVGVDREAVVTVSATIRDGLCIDIGDVVVSASITGARFRDNTKLTQSTPTEVVISGELVVYSMTGSPATLKVEIVAADCAANQIVETAEVQLLVVEDVYLTVCKDESTLLSLAGNDVRVDPVDTGFLFSIVGGPTSGVLVGDTQSLNSPLLGLSYVPNAGFIGRDAIGVRVDDPFGSSHTILIDIAVTACPEKTAADPAIVVTRGDVLQVIGPADLLAETVSLVSLGNGVDHAAAVTAVFDQAVGGAALRVDSAQLPVGEYVLTIPLGNGETVILVLAVSED